MEAVFTKSHDQNMADGEEVVIADPRNKFISNSRNPPASKRTRSCSACLGPPHDISSSERYVQALSYWYPWSGVVLDCIDS